MIPHDRPSLEAIGCVLGAHALMCIHGSMLLEEVGLG